MGLISSKAEYAFFILLDLVLRGNAGATTTRAVAERWGVPPRLAPQLVAILARRGWVGTARGAGGGLWLETDPRAVSVQDVVEAVDGIDGLRPCVSGGFSCPTEEVCALREVLLKAQQAADGVLAGGTLRAVADDWLHRHGGSSEERAGELSPTSIDYLVWTDRRLALARVEAAASRDAARRGNRLPRLPRD